MCDQLERDHVVWCIVAWGQVQVDRLSLRQGSHQRSPTNESLTASADLSIMVEPQKNEVWRKTNLPHSIHAADISKMQEVHVSDQRY